MNKYRNRKTVHREIKFDSVAEAEYYDLAVWQAEAKTHETRLLMLFCTATRSRKSRWTLYSG